MIPLLLQRPRVWTTNAVNSKNSDLPKSSRSIRDAWVQVIPMQHLQSCVICLQTLINLLHAFKNSSPSFISSFQPNSKFLWSARCEPLQEFEVDQNSSYGTGSDSQAGVGVWFNRQSPNKAPTSRLPPWIPPSEPHEYAADATNNPTRMRMRSSTMNIHLQPANIHM